ncbi:MAG: substrate-binding domain-containing protein, partial [Candidatus Adiutrix sp.]
DEISPEDLASGQKLPEFNSLILSALVRDAGGEPCVWPTTPDDPHLIRQNLLKAARSGADLIVINAGSSAGSHDYTPEIIDELGELWVHGVAIMPGKPTAIGQIEGKAVLGIPGYPISAIIAFEEFGQSLLAAWQNRQMPPRAQSEAKPFAPIVSRPGMEEYIRVKLGKVDNNLIAVPLPRGAGTVNSLSRADGLIKIPLGLEGLGADSLAVVTLIRPQKQIEGAVLAIGSHDNTLELLDSLLRKKNLGASLTSAHAGSIGGLMALKSGRCHLAGCHILGPDGLYNQKAIEEMLLGCPIRLVRLVNREQGLMVRPDNPQNISSLADLSRPEISFINRQRGSGTRLLLDWHLKNLNIAPNTIVGYDDEEYTHMNVAAAILSGRSSTGLGIKSAALALGLKFIPVGVEEYDLVILEKFWGDP